MSRLKTFTANLDDRLNPIVVKELRQVVRGRLLPMVLILYLLAMLFVMGLGLGSIAQASDISAGREVLFGFFVVFCLVAFILIPASIAFRLAMERNQENVDLIYITTMPPFRIIAGKLLAGFIQVLLFLFASLPFMTTTYMLRGIDIPTVFMMVFMALLTAMFYIQCGLLVAVLPVTRIFKGVLGLGTLFLYFIGFFSFLTWSERMSRRGVSSMFNGDWAIPLTLSIFLFATLLFFLISVALVKPPSANRARPVRIFLSFCWLISFLMVAIFATDKDTSKVWAGLCLTVCLFSLFVGVSEREELGHRIRREIPQGFLRKLPAFFHFSGKASAIAWTTAILFATLIAVFVSDPRNNEFSFACVGMALFMIAYALSGHYLYRTFFYKRFRGGFTWVISLALLFLFTIGAWLVAFFIYPNSWSNMTRSGWLHLFNPFAIGEDKWLPLYLTSSGGWCLVMLVLELRWFYARWCAFKPPALAGAEGAGE